MSSIESFEWTINRRYEIISEMLVDYEQPLPVAANSAIEDNGHTMEDRDDVQGSLRQSTEVLIQHKSEEPLHNFNVDYGRN